MRSWWDPRYCGARFRAKRDDARLLRDRTRRARPRRSWQIGARIARRPERPRGPVGSRAVVDLTQPEPDDRSREIGGLGETILDGLRIAGTEVGQRSILALTPGCLHDAAKVECFASMIRYRLTKNQVVFFGHDHAGDLDVFKPELDRQRNFEVIRPADQSHLRHNSLGFRDFIVWIRGPKQ